ncbi:hypothetical protein KHQ82_05045 [Mycoplasmatota bacterium]|nr:hypothetical protein KHQ82_05045 [Mycoplasmatota bacterium]
MFTSSEKRKAILSIVFMYSFILLFPAFGPVLNKLFSTNQSGIYSSIFLLFLSIGFLIPFGKIDKKMIHIYKLIIILLTVLIFNSSNFVIISFIFLGLIIARCIVGWIYTYYYLYLDKNISRFFGWILFLTYGILYIGNAITPSLQKNLLFILMLLFPVISFIFSLNKSGLLYSVDSVYKNNNKSSYKKIIIIILIVYIAAGTTYNGIYPRLMIYSLYERYYNVLPFLPAVLIAAYLNKKSSFILIYLGIIFLGFSFISLFIPIGVGQYILVQSNLQIAWALLDFYAWYAGAKYAMHHNNPRLQVIFIASFLLGTSLGSFVNQYLNFNILDDFGFYHAVITLLPLFVGLLIASTFNLGDDEERVNQSIKAYQFIKNDNLTKREKEITRLLLQDKTYSDICTELSISINTLKTHSKSIYRKLGVSNKSELSEYL